MIKEAMRRIRNSMAFGTTTGLVQAPDNVPMVQVMLTPLEAPTLRLVEQRGFASSLPVGTPIVASFQGGDRSNGVVTGSTAPSSRPALVGPEDAAMYGYGFIIYIASDGVHITAPEVFLSGNLHVMGEVTAKAGSSSSVTLSQHKGHDGGSQAPTPGT